LLLLLLLLLLLFCCCCCCCRNKKERIIRRDSTPHESRSEGIATMTIGTTVHPPIAMSDLSLTDGPTDIASECLEASDCGASSFFSKEQPYTSIHRSHKHNHLSPSVTVTATVATATAMDATNPLSHHHHHHHHHHHQRHLHGHFHGQHQHPTHDRQDCNDIPPPPPLLPPPPQHRHRHEEQQQKDRQQHQRQHQRQHQHHHHYHHHHRRHRQHESGNGRHRSRRRVNGVAMIPNACSSIGQGLTTELARLGYHVVLIGLDEDILTKMSDSVKDTHPNVQVLSIYGNIANVSDCEFAIKTTMEKFGALHIIVLHSNVAQYGPILSGIGKDKDKNDYEILSKWKQDIEHNLISVMKLVKIMSPYIIETATHNHKQTACEKTDNNTQQNEFTSSTAVIFISSIAGIQSYQNVSGYCASQHGVCGFANALFEEIRQYGTKVCTIIPDDLLADENRQCIPYNLAKLAPHTNTCENDRRMLKPSHLGPNEMIQIDDICRCVQKTLSYFNFLNLVLGSKGLLLLIFFYCCFILFLFYGLLRLFFFMLICSLLGFIHCKICFFSFFLSENIGHNFFFQDNAISHTEITAKEDLNKTPEANRKYVVDSEIKNIQKWIIRIERRITEKFELECKKNKKKHHKFNKIDSRENTISIQCKKLFNKIVIFIKNNLITKKNQKIKNKQKKKRSYFHNVQTLKIILNFAKKN
ncbi:hypothetical protein RFI_25739, partial [Reticulomyxa filosa]